MHFMGGKAHCGDCNWEAETRNLMALAAHHHKKFGHTVYVEVYHGHIFGGQKEDKAKEKP